MIGVVATLKVKPGQEAAFEAAFAELRRNVFAHETNRKVYDLFKSRTAADTYVVLEEYDSQEDLAAHMKASYFLAAGPALQPTLAAAPDLQFFDSVG